MKIITLKEGLYEATAWAEADRRRLGCEMDRVRLTGIKDFTDRPETLVSVFPIKGSKEALLRIDWFDDHLTRYCLLTNFYEALADNFVMMRRFVENGLDLYRCSRAS